MEMRMKATCSECERKVVESAYVSKRDYDGKRYGWVNNIVRCPHCNVRYKTRPYNNGKSVKWRKVLDGFEAEAENGTFFLFKMKSGRWVWSFRYQNEKEPRAENQGGAFLKEIAERMCEKHKEWK
jgi:hypothetical protein